MRLTGGTRLDTRVAWFAAVVLTAVLLVLAALEVWVLTRPMAAGQTTAIGIDLNVYLGYTRQWLSTGEWYRPEQLAGPYNVEAIMGNVYPPTLLYLTVPFALGLPMVLWWAIPVGIVALTFWRHRPAWWAWPLLAFVFCYPRTWTVIVLGNPAMWAIAFAVAGTAWGWAAWGAALKLTFAPLVLVGRSRRAWLVGGAVTVMLCVPFGSLWLDYVTVLRNTESSRGLAYVLGEWPIALAFVAAAASPGIAERGRDARPLLTDDHDGVGRVREPDLDAVLGDVELGVRELVPRLHAVPGDPDAGDRRR